MADIHARVTDLVRSLASALRALRQFQFWLVDEATDEILAEGNSLPVRLDLSDLPDRGWEYVLEHATNGDEEPTLVSAIQVLVDRNRHGSGVSASDARGDAPDRRRTRATAISLLPVRPSLKSAYPPTPMEEYITWRTERGTPVGTVAPRACAGWGDDREGVRRVDDHPGQRLPTGRSGRGCGSRQVAPYVVRGALEPVEIDVASRIAASTSSRTSGCIT